MQHGHSVENYCAVFSCRFVCFSMQGALKCILSLPQPNRTTICWNAGVQSYDFPMFDFSQFYTFLWMTRKD